MPPSSHEDEKALMSFRPTRFIALHYYVLLLVSLALVAVFLLIRPIKNYGDETRSVSGLGYDAVVAIFFLLIAIYCVLRAELKRYTTIYRITDNKIVRIDGILSKNTQMIPYTQLNRVDLRQSLLQRIFKIGTLAIDTGDDTLKIEMISRPKDVQELLSQRIGRLSYSQQK
jgi:uncharacterized membrane protein YdbT with pleckstrin-like domain